ncbi:MAG: hypothetical protein N2595_00895 [bacterium]|nr:hypothetical protein [bacterium]
MTLWLARYVHRRAAQVGALAWVWSLGFVWRIVVGNDMFMWVAAAPWVLLVIYKLAEAPSARTAALCALVGAGLLWGPSYHAVLFCLLPLTMIWWLWQLGKCVRGGTLALWFVGYSALASGLAVVMATPRLASWYACQMERPTPFDGTIGLWDTLRALCDYTMYTAEWIPRRGVGIAYKTWECSVALPFPALLLACAGLLVTPWARDEKARNLWLIAWVAILVGVLPACVPPVWRGLYKVLGGNARVPERFLLTAGFGIALLCAAGMHCVQRWSGRTAVYVYWGAICMLCWPILDWRTHAEKNGLLAGTWIGDVAEAALAAQVNLPEPGVVLLPIYPAEPGTFETRPMLRGHIVATDTHFQLTGVQQWTSAYSSRIFQNLRRPCRVPICNDVHGEVAMQMGAMWFWLFM